MLIPNNVNDIKTPYYFYDMDLLDKTLLSAYDASVKYNFNIHYAFKANTNSEILNSIKSYNFGADCVSGNEISRAIETGFDTNSIVFSGVGKSDEEIELAIRNSIFSINIESIEELEVVDSLAARNNIIANISIRINPEIKASTHKYITTGTGDNKFGVSIAELNNLLKNKKLYANVSILGLHFHIGSQIVNLSAFEELCITINTIQNNLYAKGFCFKYLNVGGGLGINYIYPDENLIVDFDSYFKIFREKLDYPIEQEIHFELGRSLVAQCGTLFTKVLYTKTNEHKKFAIVDAGMTDLLRPALYNAYHKIQNISSDSEIEEFDIVGPICESSDFLGQKIMINKPKRGDILAVRSVGAYGQTMSSNYNMREIAKAYYSR